MIKIREMNEISSQTSENIEEPTEQVIVEKDLELRDNDEIIIKLPHIPFSEKKTGRLKMLKSDDEYGGSQRVA